jgi:hypothetical protein
MSLLVDTLRRTAARSLDGTLPYVRYQLTADEHLGTVQMTLGEVTRRLRENGYSYQALSAIKEHPSRQMIDAGSYARIPDWHPDEVTNTALESVPPEACQYHVHPFVTEKGVQLYGHYEIHPYPHTPTFDLSRPLRHYRPTHNTTEHPPSEWTYLRGVCDERLTELF